MPFFQFDGKDVYYEEHGAGSDKPLLLLNGIMMSTTSWAEFVEPLSNGRRLILMDFLDQGKSARMTAPFSQAVQSEVVDALLRHLNVDRVDLMGISYGSEVALRFTLRRPEKVDRLMLFNATAATGPWLRDIGNAWNKAAGDGEAYYLTTIPVIYSPEFYKKNEDWMARRREKLTPVFASPVFAESMVRLTNSSADYDVRDRLGEIKCPTLVVSCQQDYLTPVEEQQFLAEQIPDSHHVILPHCGHASMYEQPLLFTSLILGFAGCSKIAYDIR